MRKAVIVQARMGSSRLPGKVLMDVAGHTALAHCLLRCATIPNISAVVCATTTLTEDDAVAAEARKLGVQVFRGSPSDLIARYHGAAVMAGADIVLRVTSDCPLIDPTLCGQVLDLLAREGADYACNNMPPSWPHGYDCEAFPTDLLIPASESPLAEDHEHVTPWIRRNEALKRVNLPSPDPALAKLRLTLDYPEDLALFRALFPLLDDPLAPWQTVIATLDAHRDVADLNKNRHLR